MEEKLVINAFYPFKTLISSTWIESFFLKKITIIARPTAASAAETLKVKKTNICPIIF